MKVDSTAPYDVVAVGIGPANLSLAALIEGSQSVRDIGLRSVCFERRDSFDWHSGQLFLGSRMQNSFVRDLVTLVDPTNRFSFLSFLKSHGRLLQFLNSGYFMPTREEFVQYFKWVASSLSTLLFGTEVTSVSFDTNRRCFAVVFQREGREGRVWANNVVVGIGHEPQLPLIDKGTSAACIHISEFLSAPRDVVYKKVAVVGAGQSAAELVDHLLGLPEPPTTLTWITKDCNIRALDTGNFSRELYTPGYAAGFRGVRADLRSALLERESGAESGVSPSLLEALYQKLYLIRHVRKCLPATHLLPGVDVLMVSYVGGKPILVCRSLIKEEEFFMTADLVVFCTGFAPSGLSILRGLVDKGLIDDLPPEIRSDYSVAWHGPPDRNIFVQSLARHTHGLSDANFTMVAHRNGAIINSISGDRVLRVDENDLLMDWWMEGEWPA